MSSALASVALEPVDLESTLMRAPHLITDLSLCISLAATKQAAQVQLSGIDLPRRDLASNLVAVASQGRNAFLVAYSNMLQIATKTNEIGRMGGTLDQVLDLFGDENAERATKRLLERLQRDITTCDESGQRTARDFQNWHDSVSKVHQGVVGAQNDTVANLTIAERQMADTRVSIKKLSSELLRVEEERKQAQTKHDLAVQNQRKAEEILRSYSFQIASKGLAACYPLMGSLVSAGVTTFVTGTAAYSVSKANEAVDSRRSVAREVGHKMHNIAADFSMFSDEKKGLDFLLEKISEVLILLAEMMNDIFHLLAFFAMLNTKIGAMIDEHESELKKIAVDQAGGEELQEADFERFAGSCKQIKKMSLTIHTMSGLYSRVITETINPGFTMAVQTSHYVSGETSVVLAQKEQTRILYLEDAERKCKASNQAATQMLQARIVEIDNSKPTRKQKKAAKKRQAARKPGFFSKLSLRSD